MTDVAELVERLEMTVSSLEYEESCVAGIVREAAAALAELAAERDRLREALGPFARIAARLDNLYAFEVRMYAEEWTDGQREPASPEFIVGDFLRARAALAERGKR